MDGIQELVNALQTNNYEPSKTYSAQVSSIDNEGTVWVYLEGSNKETPTALSSAEVNVGDSVNVEWRNNKLYIAGNVSNPSAGVETVAKVERKASEAQNTAESAKSTAESASRIAGNTNQYFWHTESGTDTGAHITEKPREDFLDDPTQGGGNLLARSNGIAVRDGLTELSSFGADGIQVGQIDESHLEMDYHSMQLTDKEGNAYFYASDLRDSDGVAVVVDNFVGNGSTTTYSITASATGTTVTEVTIDGVATTAYTFDSPRVTFDTAPPSGARIAITYETTSVIAKAYTMGIRGSGNIGAMSVAEGRNNVASGYCSHCEGYGSSAIGNISHSEGTRCVASGVPSHAEGSETTSSGVCSHSEGMNTASSGVASHAGGLYSVASNQASHALGYYVVADQPNQTAVGTYNTTGNTGNLFVVGNGTSSQRSNAFTVDGSGNVVASGSITAKATTPSISISTSTGTLVTTNIRRFGKVVQLRLTVRNSSSVASGGDVFKGTISTTALRPVIGVTGASHYGSHSIGGTIGADGGITIRNASSTAVSITGTNTTSVSFTYIVA